MDQQDRVPSLSPTEAEAFWCMGHNARTAVTGPDPDPRTSKKLEAEPVAASAAAGSLCCVGTDVPGVGYVHAAECPHRTSPAHSGRDDDAGGALPQPLRGLLAAEPLLIRLIFAANILAGKRIFSAAGMSLCFECSVVADARGVIQHAAGCSVSEVVSILAALEALNSQPGKEAAADGETGRAADGIRSRDVLPSAPQLLTPKHAYFCRSCHVTDLEWAGVKRPESYPQLAALGENQCFSAPLAGESGHIEWTHRCAAVEGGAR